MLLIGITFFFLLYPCSAPDTSSDSVNKWKDCYPGSNENLKKITILLIIDYGVYNKFNYSETKINEFINKHKRTVIDLYKQQINVSLLFKSTILKIENENPKINRFNIENKGVNQKCYTYKYELINNIDEYAKLYVVDDKIALILVITTCNIETLSGMANYEVICKKEGNVGWVIIDDEFNFKLAHEIGHMFGAHHSFEFYARGGIMDYGTMGLYENIFQFRSDHRRYEICSYLSKLTNMNGSVTREDYRNLKICFPWANFNSDSNYKPKIKYSTYINNIEKMPTSWECDGIFDSKYGDDEYLNKCNIQIEHLYKKCPKNYSEIIDGIYIQCLYNLKIIDPRSNITCSIVKGGNYYEMKIATTDNSLLKNWLGLSFLENDNQLIIFRQTSFSLILFEYSNWMGFNHICDEKNANFGFSYRFRMKGGSCKINRCLHNGKCITISTLGNKYYCICKKNYTGERCEISINDECSKANPTICKNGGSCFKPSKDSLYQCKCAGDFVGSICERCRPGENYANNCTVCKAGEYSNGYTECNKCPIHTYTSNNNSTECKFCPTANVPGSTNCVGKVCSKGKGLPDCEKCPPGTYSNGTTICTPCPKHLYSYKGSFTCYHSYKIKECNAGQDILKNCDDCPAGYFSRQNTSCIPCPINTYSENTGSTECTFCLGATKGSTSCSREICRPGEDPNNNCESCPAGTYSDGRKSCELCPQHTYSTTKAYKCNFCYGARKGSSRC